MKCDIFLRPLRLQQHDALADLLAEIVMREI